MDRYSGWADISTGPCAPRALERVRALVAAEQTRGAGVGLTGAGGRWHVWVEGTTVGQRTSVLPFFKSLGSAAPGSFGVLEVERVDPGGTRAERWVMVRGSVSRSEDSWDRIST
jgi:hypothetical protein